MNRFKLRTIINSLIIIWISINLNTLVNGGDSLSDSIRSDSIVEFRPQGKLFFYFIIFLF